MVKVNKIDRDVKKYSNKGRSGRIFCALVSFWLKKEEP
jgi:hypothetical protein